jgi:hypothetical protein
MASSSQYVAELDQDEEIVFSSEDDADDFDIDDAVSAGAELLSDVDSEGYDGELLHPRKGNRLQKLHNSISDLTVATSRFPVFQPSLRM